MISRTLAKSLKNLNILRKVNFGKKFKLMNKFKKLFVLSTLIVTFFSGSIEKTKAMNLLPGSDYASIYTEAECMDLIKEYEYSSTGSIEDFLSSKGDNSLSEDLFLGCAIKSGYVRFWMLPYFVKYVLNFIVSIAGLIVVTMIILGGYYYIAGSFTDDKEKGKTIIKYAIFGFVLILASWSLVNLLLLILTS